jgi:hypothetical protein
LVGAGLGACSQAAWLADPSPHPNWVLLEPHRFSPVGWYHAAFLVVTAGYVAASIYELLWRARRVSHDSSGIADRRAGRQRRRLRAVLSGNGSALVITAAALFVLAVVADSVPSRTTAASQATLLAVVGSALLALAVAAAMLGRDVKLLMFPVAVAVGAVISVVVLATLTEEISRVAVAIAAALLAGIGLAARLYRRGSVLRSQDARLAAALVGCLLVVSIVARLPPAQPLVVGAVVVLWLALFTVVLYITPRAPAESIRAILTAALICLTAGTSTWLSHDGLVSMALLVVLSLFLSYALGSIANYRIREAWQPMVAAEQPPDGSAFSMPSSRLGAATVQAWTAALGLGLGTILALAPMAFAIAGDTLDLGGGASVVPEMWIAFAGLVLLGALGARAVATMFHSTQFDRDKRQPKQPAAGWVIGSTSGGLVILAGITTGLAVRNGWHHPVSVAVLAAVLILALDCLLTTVVDSTFMCLRWPDWIDGLLGGLTAVVQGTALYWALLSGLDSGGAPLGYAAGLFAVAAGVRMAASIVAGGVIYARGRNRYGTFLPLWWLHVQNELLRTLMAFVLVGFPIFIVTHSRAPGAEPWINAAAAIGPILVLAIWAYWFACQRMLEHSHEQSMHRFGGRFGTAGVDYQLDPRRIVKDTFKLAKQCFVWLRASRTSAAARRNTVTPEGFIRTLSGNLALQVLIRSMLIVFTVIGGVMVLTNGSLQAPSGMSTVLTTRSPSSARGHRRPRHSEEPS